MRRVVRYDGGFRTEGDIAVHVRLDPEILTQEVIVIVRRRYDVIHGFNVEPESQRYIRDVAKNTAVVAK